MSEYLPSDAGRVETIGGIPSHPLGDMLRHLLLTVLTDTFLGPPLRDYFHSPSTDLTKEDKVKIFEFPSYFNATAHAFQLHSSAPPGAVRIRSTTTGTDRVSTPSMDGRCSTRQILHLQHLKSGIGQMHAWWSTSQQDS